MSTSIEVGEWLSSEAAGSPEPCGLFVKGTAAPLPLRSRCVAAAVYAEHGFCDVTETLSYVADEDVTARFVFPLPPRSAVFRFEATIGDRKVVTEVKRRNVAQAEYSEAVRQGHTAVHMQQQQGASLYSVEVGNLFAMEEAIVTFSYVRILNSVAGAVEFEHQATWVPPYFKAEEQDSAGQPLPALAQANPVLAQRVSYTLSYSVKVQSSRGFRSIESPLAVAITEEGPHVRMVSLADTVSDPSRDFTLLIELPPLSADRSNAGQLLLQQCDRQGGKKQKQVALATFVPRLMEQPAGAAPSATEIIFVIDGSGSMGGTPIRQALEAALFFVKDLPSTGHISFNAAMFGDRHQLMWKAARQYNAETQQQAVAWLQSNVNANWGGTEVLKALSAIYETVPLAAGTSRQIIFLTDGGISGDEERGLYQLVKGEAGSSAARAAAARTTVFSLGIGHGVHRGLVEGVAQHSGGLAQFVVDEEPIGRKAGLLKRCALAAASGCWAQPRLVSRSCIVRAAPNVLPPRLFPDEPLHVLVEVVRSEPGACLELSALPVGAAEGGAAQYTCSLPLDSAVQVPGDAFAVLHAMASIGALLGGNSALHCSSDGVPLARQPDSRAVEDAVVALAEEEGLVTPHTSAVGVLLQRDPADPAAVQQVEVALQVPAGRALWQQGDADAADDMSERCCKLAMASGGGGGGTYMQQVVCKSQSLQCSADMFQKSGKVLRNKGGMLSSLAAAVPRALSSLLAAATPAKRCASSSAAGRTFALSPAPPAWEQGDDEVKCRARAPVSRSNSGDMYSSCADDGSDAAAVPQVGSERVVSGAQVLSLLNLRRTVHGSVPATKDVLLALAGEAFKQQQQQAGAGAGAEAQSLSQVADGLLSAAVRPAALTSDEAWSTVLALAYLRKHLAAERSVWGGLEAKALEWLATVWPQDAGRSVGSVVLAAMKLL